MIGEMKPQEDEHMALPIVVRTGMLRAKPEEGGD